jgi:mono/diheme cytochrome c family protein
MKYFLIMFAVITTALFSSAFVSFTTPKLNTVIQKSSTPMSRGKAVYAMNCMPCHQVDGSGVPNMNPPLIKTTYVLGSKATLVSIIVKGLNIGVVIDGEQYTNPMPAQSNLTDQQIADVATYVRNSFGNKAAGLTLAEVKAIKAKLK